MFGEEPPSQMFTCCSGSCENKPAETKVSTWGRVNKTSLGPEDLTISTSLLSFQWDSLCCQVVPSLHYSGLSQSQTVIKVS